MLNNWFYPQEEQTSFILVAEVHLQVGARFPESWAPTLPENLGGGRDAVSLDVYISEK